MRNRCYKADCHATGGTAKSVAVAEALLTELQAMKSSDSGDVALKYCRLVWYGLKIKLAATAAAPDTDTAKAFH